MYADQRWDRQRRVIVKAEHLVKGDNTRFIVTNLAAAYILVDTLRRQGLADTELANAQVGTIRLKLLKIGSRIVYSVRRIVIHLAGGYPLKGLFVQVLSRLSCLRLPKLSIGFV